VTGIEVVIRNCLLVYLAPLWRYGGLKFFQEGSSRHRGQSVDWSVSNITLMS